MRARELVESLVAGHHRRLGGHRDAEQIHITPVTVMADTPPGRGVGRGATCVDSDSVVLRQG